MYMGYVYVYVCICMYVYVYVSEYVWGLCIQACVFIFFSLKQEIEESAKK